MTGAGAEEPRIQFPAEVRGEDQLPGAGLPVQWLAAWSAPSAELRPLQIVHGLPAGQATPEAMSKLKELGLGGIVCNVNFNQYLRSQEHWQALINAVQACAKTGLVVWIYDEDGYPSGAAGGLVLEKDVKFEALALAYDPSLPDRFILRASYEHTHASNNFYAARRYPNLLDAEAVECFVKVTHDAYWERLKGFFGSTIKAFFTDEPSLMATNIGPLPAEVAKNVRVADPLDESIKPLASVPWVADLAAKYKERYGEDIAPVRKSLFAGDSDDDRRVRRQFWALVTDLFAERYYGRLKKWAGEHKVASSGHILWEEQIVHGVPLEGNPLKMLMQMQIPGLDMLTSDPEAVIYTGWLTASLPGSAAIFNGGRRVMTEVSDFSENMAKRGPASLEQMCATAAWQAAMGVTEFTLYYNRAARSPEDYRAYCDFVGRLNALLREARAEPSVLLYYPIYDAWGEYLPIAEKLTVESQSERMKTIVNSFMSLGQRMTRRQIPFALADHELLGSAAVRNGQLFIKGRGFDTLVLPSGVELPAGADKQMKEFETAGGKVVRGGEGAEFRELSGIVSGAGDRVVVGRFTRGWREIVLIVNVGGESVEATITAPQAAQWLRADPGSGRIKAVRAAGPDKIAVSLGRRCAVILIGPIRQASHYGVNLRSC
ncbi:MAG: hypothetical protein JXN61_11405 [Sedimentisphaerales bacterium]|nr:hypothetical protein [Sedimentisphaerales bacterium]